jgi:hypothetical protein
MTKTIFIAAVLVIVTATIPAVYAYESAVPLEKYLQNVKLASDAVKIASENKGAGSGTPFLAADGVVGASAISASVFGGIAAMFFLKGRHGRYVAQGRG